MAQATNVGYSSEILNTAVDGSTWTAISFSKIPNNMLIHSRAGTALKVSLVANGATYITIPAGQSMTYDWNPGKAQNVIYIQGAGADTAEIVATYEG